MRKEEIRRLIEIARRADINLEEMGFLEKVEKECEEDKYIDFYNLK
ncbi:MAG: hypothetical protein M0Q13_15355 [Methanothrix sp.]|jgi:hypothetical protein|nr:hypothetical protein [Methanothrix sp.]